MYMESDKITVKIIIAFSVLDIFQHNNIDSNICLNSSVTIFRNHYGWWGMVLRI